MYALGFSAFSGIGTKRFEKLVDVFGSAENAWTADVHLLQKAIGQLTAKRFDTFRKTFDVKKYAEEVNKKGIYWFVPKDAEYPPLLKQLNNVIPAQAGIQEYGSRIKSGMTRTPFILFAKGNLSLLQNDTTIGIVGTRKVTSYGQEVTEMFTRDLVHHNFVIVSGMALGVDGIAHKTALKENGKTIAVLGSGVDVPTPREHAQLYEQILENNGLIVSTFNPGEDANVGSFPARNAIIAGLSRGILVTEGAVDSGSLITAQYAKTFDRFLFSVPGQITSQLSKGTNNLIKQGAVPVGSAQEILDTLGIMETQNEKQTARPRMSLTKEEQKIFDLLEKEPLHFDEIVRTIGKDSKEIGSVLSLMELKGILKTDSEGKYFL